MPHALRLSALLLALCSGCRPPAEPETPPASASPATSATAAQPVALIEPPDPLTAVITADGYDATPLLQGIRPSMRPNVARLSGLDRLDALPLYDLRVFLDPAAGVLEVEEELFFTNRDGKPLRELVLRIYPNVSARTKSGSPKAPHVAVIRSGCDKACDIRLDSPSVVTVVPQTPIAPGERLRVNLSLRGVLDRIDSSRTDMLSQSLESLMSLGKEPTGDYGLLAVGDGMALAANTFAMVARRVDGTWDRGDGNGIGDIGSDELGHVRAWVEVPAGVEALTVGTTVGSALRRREGRLVRALRIAAPLVRDFAISAGEAASVATAQVGEVTVRSLYRPQDDRMGRRVLDTTARALETFERRFGPYPYTELDACEAALLGGAGGVEFAGLLTVASMFYHAGEGGPFQELLGEMMGEAAGGQDSTGGMVDFVTAHEVAHQWWHGLVGSDSREHPFLDESLAQWTTMLFFQERASAEEARHHEHQSVKANYHMMRMMGIPDGPVDRPASAFPNSIAYAGLVYGKGPFFFVEARKAMGDEAFFGALRGYVQTWQFRTAPRQALIDALSKGPHEARVRALARRWLVEAHGDKDLGKPQLPGLAGGLGGLGGTGGMGDGSVGADTMKQLMQWLQME